MYMYTLRVFSYTDVNRARGMVFNTTSIITIGVY